MDDDIYIYFIYVSTAHTSYNINGQHPPLVPSDLVGTGVRPHSYNIRSRSNNTWIGKSSSMHILSGYNNMYKEGGRCIFFLLSNIVTKKKDEIAPC